MSVKEFISRSEVRNLLALIVVILSFAILIFKNPDESVKIALVGWVGIILGYYFGDSKSSQIKKDL